MRGGKLGGGVGGAYGVRTDYRSWGGSSLHLVRMKPGWSGKGGQEGGRSGGEGLRGGGGGGEKKGHSHENYTTQPAA